MKWVHRLDLELCLPWQHARCQTLMLVTYKQLQLTRAYSHGFCFWQAFFYAAFSDKTCHENSTALHTVHPYNCLRLINKLYLLVQKASVTQKCCTGHTFTLVLYQPFKKAYTAMGKKGICKKASQYINALNHSGGWSIMGSLKVAAYHCNNSVSLKKRTKQQINTQNVNRNRAKIVTLICWSDEAITAVGKWGISSWYTRIHAAI